METQRQTASSNRRLMAPGNRYLSFARACDKLSRAKSWLYDKLKNDPTFPKPINLAGRPALIESEIDAWVAKEATRPFVAKFTDEQLAAACATRRQRARTSIEVSQAKKTGTEHGRP